MLCKFLKKNLNQASSSLAEFFYFGTIIGNFYKIETLEISI